MKLLATRSERREGIPGLAKGANASGRLNKIGIRRGELNGAMMLHKVLAKAFKGFELRAVLLV